MADVATKPPVSQGFNPIRSPSCTRRARSSIVPLQQPSGVAPLRKWAMLSTFRTAALRASHRECHSIGIKSDYIIYSD